MPFGDASLLPCLTFDDHRLLADLDLAVLEAAGALVDVQDGAGRDLLQLDEPERARDRALAEQALAGAEDDRELPEAQLVDEIVREQGLDELAAAVDLKL